MVYIIGCCMIIIAVLIYYLFILKKDIKRVAKEIVINKNNDSNTLIHSEISSKELSLLITEINKLLKDKKDQEILFEQNNKKVKKMMTNISHDLKTPLTSALGYISMIKDSNLSKEKQEKNLEIIENRLLRLNELITSFFEFSKIIASDKLIEKEKVNIISVIEESMVHYYEDFVKEKREIILTSAGFHCYILSNKEMLLRIFDNLIANAFQHSNSNLEIKIIKEDSLQIHFINELVDDSLDIGSIFDEFYTTDISRTKGNTGLGLAIAKEFTERLNGSIRASKKNGMLEIIMIFD